MGLIELISKVDLHYREKVTVLIREKGLRGQYLLIEPQKLLEVVVAFALELMKASLPIAKEVEQVFSHPFWGAFLRIPGDTIEIR